MRYRAVVRVIVRFVSFLDAYRPEDRLVQRALALVRDWNYDLAPSSVAATIYVFYERRLWARALDRLVPQRAQPYMATYLTRTKVIDWLTAPDSLFGEDPVAARDALVADSFEEAVAELTAVLGSDLDAWRYGQAQVKHIRLSHPLSAAVDPDLRARLDLGPLPRGGYGHTVNSTSDNLNQTHGASFRIITDTGNWDLTLGTNAPGQSGNPDSPHYSDVYEPRAEGKYFPVFYSRSKIESVTEAVTHLVPGP